MPTRKLTMFAAVVALSGVFALPMLARADQDPPKAEKGKAKRDPTQAGGTAKAGEACKVDADCDQSGRAMICGRNKCEYDVSKMPVKT